MDIFGGNKNIFSVFREADNLYINIPYEKKIKIFPKSQSKFYGTTNLFGDVLIDFSKPEKGKVKHMHIQFAFMKFQADKIE